MPFPLRRARLQTTTEWLLRQKSYSFHFCHVSGTVTQNSEEQLDTNCVSRRWSKLRFTAQMTSFLQKNFFLFVQCKDSFREAIFGVILPLRGFCTPIKECNPLSPRGWASCLFKGAPWGRLPYLHQRFPKLAITTPNYKKNFTHFPKRHKIWPTGGIHIRSRSFRGGGEF